MTSAPRPEPVDCPSLVLRPLNPDEEAVSEGDEAARQAVGRRLRWQLSDPWAPPDRPPAAVATTNRVRQLVQLVQVSVAADAPAGTARCIVQQLVATLRRTDAAVVWCALPDRTVRKELVAVGFVALPEEGEASARPARLILQL